MSIVFRPVVAVGLIAVGGGAANAEDLHVVATSKAHHVVILADGGAAWCQPKVQLTMIVDVDSDVAGNSSGQQEILNKLQQPLLAQCKQATAFEARVLETVSESYAAGVESQWLVKPVGSISSSTAPDIGTAGSGASASPAVALPTTPSSTAETTAKGAPVGSKQGAIVRYGQAHPPMAHWTMQPIVDVAFDTLGETVRKDKDPVAASFGQAATWTKVGSDAPAENVVITGDVAISETGDTQVALVFSNMPTVKYPNTPPTCSATLKLNGSVVINVPAVAENQTYVNTAKLSAGYYTLEAEFRCETPSIGQASIKFFNTAAIGVSVRTASASVLAPLHYADFVHQ